MFSPLIMNAIRMRAGALLLKDLPGSMRSLSTRAPLSGKWSPYTGVVVDQLPSRQIPINALFRQLESNNVLSLPMDGLWNPSVLPSEVLFGKAGGGKKGPPKSAPPESGKKDKSKRQSGPPPAKKDGKAGMAQKPAKPPADKKGGKKKK